MLRRRDYIKHKVFCAIVVVLYYNHAYSKNKVGEGYEFKDDEYLKPHLGDIDRTINQVYEDMKNPNSHMRYTLGSRWSPTSKLVIEERTKGCLQCRFVIDSHLSKEPEDAVKAKQEFEVSVNLSTTNHHFDPPKGYKCFEIAYVSCFRKAEPMDGGYFLCYLSGKTTEEVESYVTDLTHPMRRLFMDPNNQEGFRILYVMDANKRPLEKFFTAMSKLILTTD